MSAIGLTFALLLVAALCACGRASYTPGKGEIMAATQVRHTKLGLAGRSENWPLVEFELHELEEGFEDVATFHPELAERLSRHVDAPIRELRAATSHKDAVAFAISYDSLTNACNACHAESDSPSLRSCAPPPLSSRIRTSRRSDDDGELQSAPDLCSAPRGRGDGVRTAVKEEP